MKTSIRWKLLGSYLLIALVMGGALYFHLLNALERQLAESVTEHLLNEGSLASLTASTGIRDLRRDAPGIATEIGRRISARVTVMAPDGTVVGDSEVPADRLSGIDNHLSRPEIQQAIKSGRGSSTRYSTTIKTDMLYVALPYPVAGEGTGAIRLALPLTAVDRLKFTLHSTLGGALLLAALISLAMSSILSQIMYRPLRQVALLADEIARGNLSRRLHVKRNDELGNLARAMNGMAASLQEQLHKLASERNRQAAILRGMGEGLMVTDSQGTITLANPAFCSMFGVREEVTGQPLIDISRHPTLHDSFRLIIRDRSEHIEETTIHMPGEKTVLTHWVPLLEHGELRGVVAVFHDITDLKRLEKIRKDFVANVSHELRTPVTVIKGYAETLLGGLVTEDPERAVRFVEIIHNHSDRLSALIGDLLTLSELESGEFTLQLQPVPLAGTIRHAAGLLELKAAEKGIVIDLAGVEASTQVMADQGRLEQVFINLLDNTVKYTPESGSVAVSTEEQEQTVTVKISDTGPGIPHQSIDRIFERFYRVDTGRSREQGGTGLGLAIVKHIVQLHKGTVAVESTPGKGTTFTLSLRKPE